MIAQWQLKERYEIDTGDVNLEEVPNREKWLSYQNQKDGKVKIPLYKSYELLKDLNDPLGNEIEDIEGLLSTRNNSILAHGVIPIKREQAEKFIEKIEIISQKYISEFKDILTKLKFPWD